MSTTIENRTSWRKSSHSGGNGACVEIRVPAADRVAVRDSKDPEGPQLSFSPRPGTRSPPPRVPERSAASDRPRAGSRPRCP